MILTVTLNAAIDKRYVVDDFKVGEVNRVKECSYVPGGKGLNVSKPASIYGAEVVATGFVGGHGSCGCFSMGTGYCDGILIVIHNLTEQFCAA